MNEFEKVIKEYLEKTANEDELFKAKYDSSKIKDCCNYIINQVKQSGRNGFADEEIYKMARDFYNDGIDPSKVKKEHATVVVNHSIELSKSEKDKAKEQAIKEYKNSIIAEEKKKAAKEAEKEEKRIQAKKEKEAKEKGEQLSMFDLL